MAAVTIVSDRRIRFLTAAYAELGFAEEEARNRALLVYAAYAGLLHLRNESSPWLRSAKTSMRLSSTRWIRWFPPERRHAGTPAGQATVSFFFLQLPPPAPNRRR